MWASARQSTCSPTGLRAPGNAPTSPCRFAWRRAVSPTAFQRASSSPPFAGSACRLSQACRSATGYSTFCRLPCPIRRQGIGPRGAVSPQRVRAEIPRAFAASRGRRARDSTDCVAIVTCSNNSPAAKCGPHNHWRSVRQQDAEQRANSKKTPAKAGLRVGKKIFQVFGN